MGDRDTPAGTVAVEPTLPAADGVDAPLGAGTVLAGRFEIDAALGLGGAGAVYAARDRLLGDQVALKVLHAQLRDDPRELDRLRAEVRAARRITHPNVCRVHDLVDDGRVAFVVMELLRGETLRARMRRGVSAGEAIEIARQLALGLAAAHRAGIVHCDVKPENVVIAGERAAITDFGIARAVGTRVASVEGTPAYMAPEQLRGEPATERTDVYGLAAVAFELLAGAPPFGHAHDQPLSALLEHVEHTAPRLPDAVSRAALDAVFARGLAKDPGDRFESPGAFFAALASVVHRDAPRATTAGVAGVAETRESTRPLARGRGAARTRRIVTIVHVAIEERSDAADDERALDRIEALMAAAGEALVDSGGVVIGTAPRAVVAAFGATSSRGDEPERAADAARSLAGAARDDLDVVVRAGIDTGRLLVRAGDGDAPAVVGEALGRAARLAAEAAAGEVLASARTARHLARRFALRDAAPDAVAVGARGPDADVDRDAFAPLFGRDRELRAAIETLAAAARDGAPRSVLVLGAAGIGKSRLRREVVDALRARTGLRVLGGSATPDHALASYALVRGLMREVAGAEERPEPADALRRARRVLRRDDPDADDAVAGALADLIADRPVAHARLALAASRAALAAAARERPALVLLDDAHWADDATLELVESIARGDVGGAVAQLVLARPELVARRPALREAFGLVIELYPLPAADSERLVAALLGDGAGAATVRALADAGEGSPFFIEELARDHRERGTAGASVPTPATVAEAVQARIDRLGDEERALLRSASVLGRAFRRADLEALVRELEPERAEAVDAALGELARRGIAYPLPPDAEADDRYAFRHALVQEVAYDQLTAAERRTRHDVVARALAALLGDDAGAQRLIELARHQERAGDTARAAATYRRAGDAAAGHAVPADALRCYDRARSLVDDGDGVDLELEVARGEALLHVGRLDDAEGALAAVCDAATDRALRARALWARAAVARELTRWDDAAALARRGLDDVDEREDPVMAAKLRRSLSWVLAYRGDTAAGLDEGTRAVTLLEGRGEPAALGELAAAYSSLGAIHFREGRWREQLACYERCLAIAAELGALELRGSSELNLAVTALNLGQVERAVGHARRAIDLWGKMGATSTVALAHNNLALALIAAGALDAAEREVVEAERLSDLCGGWYFRVEADLSHARIAVGRGDLERAAAHARHGIARAKEQSSPVDEGVARRVLGAILSRGGHADAAAAELARAVELLRDADAGEHARARAEQARHAARAGDGATAAALRAEVRPVFERLGAALDLARLDDDDWV